MATPHLNHPRISLTAIASTLLGLLIASGCASEDKSGHTLIDPANIRSGQVRGLTGDSLSVTAEGTIVDFRDDRGSSVLHFFPAHGHWDGSGYRFVRCEIENLGTSPQLIELGFEDYDLTLGATMVPPEEVKSLKAVIYRTEHPAYIDRLFPVMHGKPDGTLRGWMASTTDSIAGIKLLFPELSPGVRLRIGRIWLEEPYILHPPEELKARYYPFVDSFGQFLFDDWPDKIGSLEDLKQSYERENLVIQDKGGMPELDRFGGWAGGPRLEATGRFRVEKWNGKWWFVDPEGRLFWSHGLDCVEFGTQTRTRITDREMLFTYLPGENAPEGRLYTRTAEREDTIRWLSFHALNLFRIHGEGWREVSAERIHDRFRSWGMNTIGNWSDPAIYLKRKTPYVLTAYSLKTGIFADPFTGGFTEYLVEELRSKKDELNDPWCVGVFIDNELKWGVKWGPRIVDQLTAAPPDQPGKVALKNFLEQRHGSVEDLNRSWGTGFMDWEDFLANESVIVGDPDDTRAFMVKFASRYFSSCREAVRHVDPEMLYLGCRMDFHLYPEDTSLNHIIRVAARYCDVVSFNRYRYTCSGLVPPDSVDYPIIIGEFHFGSLETGLLQPGLKYAADPLERADLYRHYVSSALKNPYIVGTHWFQLADQAVTGRPDGENYQAGFLTVGDVPQKEIVEASRTIGRNMFHIRSSNIP